ncbi:AAA family ATPase [Fusobacterium ulcerans]|uniref:AAA-ATPase-like domain-containing protein n=1 Tax=Fusobacterium ulcerans 12-1B TaxID=457404 RepID=H1PS53_9FUSO|nr:AAA family ATPase [Fusobacterium ulcerans]EHO82002.1 hypothetical protein HMPREF0402_01246 [Fusobacterium ulcerans 12-1B]
MNEIKKLPTGISDFETIIENNYYYIDKTLFIEEIGKNIGKTLLFTRPRRFGKTLNMSTLKYFFDIKEAEKNRKLFEGLNIEKTPYISEQGKYPVIFISFKDIKEMSINNCEEQLKQLISSLYRDNLNVIESLDEFDREDFVNICRKNFNQVTLSNSLKFLSKILYEYYKQKVIILIDEYDTPLVSAHQYGYYDEALNLFKGLYSSALKDNLYLHMGVITGIIRVNKAGIFSDLNNLSVNTIMENEYSEYFGITEKEVEEMLSYYDMEYEMPEVKLWYDGYRFGNAEIYNPWSILNFVRSQELKAYWIDTSENYLINHVIKNAGEDLFDALKELFAGKSVEETITGNSSMSTLLTQQEIWELMLFSGYLTIDKKIERNQYLVKIPNKEVQDFFKDKFIEISFGGYSRFYNAMRALKENNIERFEILLQQMVLNSLSYHDTDKEEKFYHILLLGMIQSLDEEYHIHSNQESGLGRYDIELEPRNKNKRGYILELKVASSEEQLKERAEEGLAQISEKKYGSVLKERGIKEITYIRIAFHGKKVCIKYCNV